MSSGCYNGVLVLLGRFYWDKILKETINETLANIQGFIALDWIFNANKVDLLEDEKVTHRNLKQYFEGSYYTTQNKK